MSIYYLVTSTKPLDEVEQKVDWLYYNIKKTDNFNCNIDGLGYDYIIETNAGFGYKIVNYEDFNKPNIFKEHLMHFMDYIKCQVDYGERIYLCAQICSSSIEDMDKFNLVYEDEVIDISKFILPEDNFEFSFNKCYKFIYLLS